MKLVAKTICKIMGHDWRGHTKSFSISVGSLGTLQAKQMVCRRCGETFYESHLEGNITYDNFLKACSTSIDKTIDTIIYPSNTDDENMTVVTNGTVRKPRTKKADA